MGLPEGLEIRSEPDRREGRRICRRFADLGHVRIADEAAARDHVPGCSFFSQPLSTTRYAHRSASRANFRLESAPVRFAKLPLLRVIEALHSLKRVPATQVAVH
jgi:hypothetical protein